MNIFPEIDFKKIVSDYRRDGYLPAAFSQTKDIVPGRSYRWLKIGTDRNWSYPEPVPEPVPVTGTGTGTGTGTRTCSSPPDCS